MKKKSFNLIPLYIGIFILTVDILSKSMIHLFLPRMSFNSIWYPYGGIGVFRNLFGIEFSINHAINKGAAWGIFAEFQEYLLAIRIVCILGLIVYLIFFNKNNAINLPCSMIVAGALGNVIDTFLYGHVIDMFHFVFWGYSYPVFNIADASIFIGIMWLLFTTSGSKVKKRKSTS